MAVDSLHGHTGPSPVHGPQVHCLTTGTAPHLPKLGERQALGFIANSLLLDKIVGGSLSNLEMLASYFFFLFFLFFSFPFLLAAGILAHVVQAREQLWSCMQAG